MTWRKSVTPLAGVWIEICRYAPSDVDDFVTPLAGVWIEMTIPVSDTRTTAVTPLAGMNEARRSLPLRECGLKSVKPRTI